MLKSGLVDLFLLRHGIAVERDHDVDHPDRGLTALGIERTARCALAFTIWDSSLIAFTAVHTAGRVKRLILR